jgi:hypothetical protein
MTSDYLRNSRRETDKPWYAIITTGLKIVFKAGLYNDETEEALALQRASGYNARLYRKDNDGCIFQIHGPGNSVRVDRRTSIESQKMNREMMGNDPYIPGIQISSH